MTRPGGVAAPHDPFLQRPLASLLADLPQAKIVITHDMPFALAMCSRAVFFESGKVAAEGTVEELMEKFGWSFDRKAGLRR